MRDGAHMMIVDNCCQWRNKLKSVFQHATVKLDLFHAVQRISKHIPMRSQFRRDIMNSLRLVFRQTNYTEVNRKKKQQHQTVIK